MGSPGVNTGCECDTSGWTCSLPECYSVSAAAGVRSQAAGRTAVSQWPLEDRPLKRGPDSALTVLLVTRLHPPYTSSICPHTRQKHIHLLKPVSLIFSLEDRLRLKTRAKFCQWGESFKTSVEMILDITMHD